MKRIAILFAACVLSTGAMAQNADQAAAMKAWQEFMTPGEVHNMMLTWDGNWATTSKSWMDPKGEAQTSTGTCENRMVLGGRYQESKFTGDMMGMPFEGLGMLAYDKAKKKFASTWVDNMGTGITVMEGTWNAASKSISFKGVTTDPSTGKDVKMRELYTIKGDNNHTMEMWMTDPKSGKEFKTMEIEFTRR